MSKLESMRKVEIQKEAEFILRIGAHIILRDRPCRVMRVCESG